MSDHASCFCDDPAEARDLFLAQCLKTGLSPLSLPAWGESTPGNDDGLFCDVVRLGAPSAHSTIVLCTGAAGMSGLVNAGICSGLLENRVQRHLDRHVSIVLVHAFNPLGPVWPKPPTPEEPILVDGDAISKAEANWTRELLSAVDRRFGTELGNTVDTTDASDNPAGDMPTDIPDKQAPWSPHDLDRIAEEFLSEAQFVLSLDFRTGIGQWAVPSFRNTDPPAAAARGRARRWFGPLEGERAATAEHGNTPGHPGSGGLAGMAPDAASVAMVVDFGTFPGTGLVNTVTGRHQTNQVYPAQRDWRDKVYAQAEAIVMRAIDAAEEMAEAGRRVKSAEAEDF